MTLVATTALGPGRGPDQMGQILGSQGSGFFVLNTSLTVLTGTSAALTAKALGTAGSLNGNTSPWSHGDNVKPMHASTAYRFLDVYAAVLGNSASLTTGATVRVLGRASTSPGSAIPLTPSEHSSLWPDLGDYWCPLHRPTDEMTDIVLPTNLVVSGANTTAPTTLVQIYKPISFRLSGATEVAAIITSVGTAPSSTGTMLLGRFTS